MPLQPAVAICLRLGQEPRTCGFAFGFDLGNSGADERAVLLSGGGQFPGQRFDARLIASFLPLDLLPDYLNLPAVLSSRGEGARNAPTHSGPDCQLPAISPGPRSEVCGTIEYGPPALRRPYINRRLVSG
jgi:hypothetical protein